MFKSAIKPFSKEEGGNTILIGKTFLGKAR